MGGLFGFWPPIGTAGEVLGLGIYLGIFLSLHHADPLTVSGIRDGVTEAQLRFYGSSREDSGLWPGSLPHSILMNPFSELGYSCFSVSCLEKIGTSLHIDIGELIY